VPHWHILKIANAFVVDRDHTFRAVPQRSPVLPLIDAHGWNRYRILCELGQGGMASVHLALLSGDAGFRKLVALKQLRSALSGDPEFLEMFMNEARLAARLNHPHVVQTYEVGWRDARPFIAMELLEGQPLHRVQQAAPAGIPLRIHLRIISEALAGLHHAHELRDFSGAPLAVVHRDVSPQNVLVGYDGQAKVVDFGIAKAATHPSITEVGLVKGKVSYLSPEQALGEPLDRRTDLFAIGVMLWEAAAGKRLWSGESLQQRLRLLLSGEIPALREVNRDVPPELERICRRALEYSVDRRYQTALELEAELEALRAEPGLRATRQDVATFMQRHFQAPRQRLQQLIEAELGQLTLNELGAPSSARKASIAAVPLQDEHLGMPVTVAVSRARWRARHSIRRWLGLSLAAVLALSVVAWFAFARSEAGAIVATRPESATAIGEAFPKTVQAHAPIAAASGVLAATLDAPPSVSGVTKRRVAPDTAPRRRSSPEAVVRRSRY
jgi:serine/threonine protein kinase